MTKNICHALLNARLRPSEQIAVKYSKHGDWQSMTWKEYFRNVELVAGGLRTLGLQAKDVSAIFSNTRLEWALADIAAISIGVVSVPIYASNTSDDISYILNDCGAKIIFVENQDLLKKFLEVKSKCPQVKHIVLMSGQSDLDSSVIHWKDLLQKGEGFLQNNREFLREEIEKIQLSDLATIVYTSGTTGRPKGVMLTHLQIMSEISEVFAVLGVSDKDTSLTFLPYAHILGRVEHFGHIMAGFTMGYAESIDRIRANLLTIKPTFMVAVPRIFEKIYNGVITQAEASPTKKKIFNWAVDVGKQISKYKIEKRSIPIPVLLQYRMAKKLVFDKLAEKMGGNLRFALSGGAPLSKEIGEFFHAANFLILEGYGLTETTAGVTLNSPFSYRFGTVGKPFGEVQIKIAEDGEIIVKSDKIMTGYYNNKAATDEVLKDGWFATGDIGEFTPDGFLRITDRKKDLIKTAGGKYVAPQRLENLLKLNKYVSNVLIHGDKKKFVVALIAPNFENLVEYAKNHNINYIHQEELTKNSAIKELIRQAVAEANSQLASFESIKTFAVLDHDFTIEAGELTPSLKVRRKFCDAKYESVINSLYGSGD